jgi:hypothetical protein
MILREPVVLKFGPEEEAKRNTYVYENITGLNKDLRELRENKIKIWRKLKAGLPEQDKKTFPWRGASNIVVQVIATNIDTLLAQIMAAIYETSPLWPISLIGDWPAEEESEEKRRAVEEFLTLMGHERDELDLYRVESVLFDGAIGYGFSVAKVPWVTDFESVCIGEYRGTPMYRNEKTKDGPRPEVIPFEDFGCTPTAPTIEEARFKFHVLPLSKWDLQERSFTGRYDKDKVDKILHAPDRGSIDQVKQDQFSREGINVSASDYNQTWFIYECHYDYWVRTNGTKRKLKVIEFYHLGTKTSLRAMHNWYPDNQNIFIGAQLGYTDRGLYEQGFCEMLEHAQKELTAEHNRYADNETLANTSLFRVDPDSATRLDSNFSIYPTAIIPLRQNEFEVFNIGRAGSNGIDRERQAIELVKMRTGVDNGFTAAGTGIVNPKRGIYSAMGTFAALQAGNRRSNLRSNDMRLAHVLLGKTFLKQYSEFGINSKLRYFGDQAQHLAKALENIRQGKMRIPVRAAIASINREIEKQSDMLLVNMLRQHYMAITQILQGLQQAPPGMQDYLVNTVVASDFLMRHILRDFGYDDINKLIPEPMLIKQFKEQMANAARQQKQLQFSAAGLGAGTTDRTQGTAASPIPQQSLLPTNPPQQGAGFGGAGVTAEQPNIPVPFGNPSGIQ